MNDKPIILAVEQQAALRDSENRFRQLFAAVPDALFVLDPTGRFLDCNEAAEQRYGFSRAELLQMTAQDLAALDLRDQVGDRVKRASETGGAFEWRHRRKDGTELPVEIHAQPVEMGGQTLILSCVRDLTERKRAEEVQRAGQRRFELVLEGSQVGYWDWDLQTGKVDRNARWAEMLGYSLQEIELNVKQWSDLQHPDDREGAWRSITDHLEGRTPAHRAEYRMRAKDGQYKWILDQARIVERDAQGKPLRMSGTHTDITERKRLELDRQKYYLLAESSSEFIGMCDLAMQPLYVNPAGRRMVGLPDLAAACRVNVQDYFFPEDQEFMAQEFFPRVLREDQGDLEIRLRHFQTGEPIWLIYHLFSVRDADGTAVGWATVSHDITERKRAEAEREKLRDQLAQAQRIESVGRLAGGVAHDFNNMLGVILGHAELLLAELDAGHPFHADLTEIRKAALRSADLTRQLLAFARKQTVAPKVIDLNQVVSGMLKMLQRLIGEDIQMAWVPGQEVWPVKIDPGQIDQILANLCVNARDAIAGVGKVTIETGNADFDDAYCADQVGFVPGEYVMLAVSDDGCGMDAETRSKVFEPFFTTKELGKGTGLGLATVYGAVKQNDGFINVYSEPGHGTTFKIYLPRHLAKADPLPEKGPEKPGQRGSETILLVEDEPAILRLTTVMLEREGYTVVSAGTPGEAIRLANEHVGPIHLLMSDVVMPEMNGRDLAKNILSLYPGVRCLFMSGYTANVIAHHGVLDEGVNFIQKPFSVKDLAAKVRAALERE